jgi:hypothetical protein
MQLKKLLICAGAAVFINGLQASNSSNVQFQDGYLLLQAKGALCGHVSLNLKPGSMKPGDVELQLEAYRYGRDNSFKKPNNMLGSLVFPTGGISLKFDNGDEFGDAGNYRVYAKMKRRIGANQAPGSTSINVSVYGGQQQTDYEIDEVDIANYLSIQEWKGDEACIFTPYDYGNLHMDWARWGRGQ